MWKWKSYEDGKLIVKLLFCSVDGEIFWNFELLEALRNFQFSSLDHMTKEVNWFPRFNSTSKYISSLSSLFPCSIFAHIISFSDTDKWWLFQYFVAQQNEFQSKIHNNHIRHFNLIFSREASKPKSIHKANTTKTRNLRMLFKKSTSEIIQQNENSICSPVFPRVRFKRA